jgi:hypothetical protein
MAEGEQSFWTTLPGILTGLAAVITALVGVAALVASLPSDPGTTTSTTSASEGTGEQRPAGPSSGTAGSSTVEVPAGPAGGATEDPSGEGPAGAKRVEMARGDRLDVDTAVVGNDVDGADVSYYFGNGYLYMHGVRHAIVDSWTDQAGCTKALEERSDNFVSPDRFGDSAVCLLTDEEAMAQFLPYRPDDSDRMTVDVIVWE